MHPRKNLRYYRVIDGIRQIQNSLSYANEALQWELVVTERFAFLEAQTIAPYVDAPDESPFTLYFSQRTGGLKERFDLFEALFSIEDMNFVLEAYEATRYEELLLNIPDNLDEAAKKNGSSTGSNSKSIKKSKRNGRSKSATPNTSKTAEANG
jgi:hypothetical protein